MVICFQYHYIRSETLTMINEKSIKHEKSRSESITTGILESDRTYDRESFDNNSEARSTSRNNLEYFKDYVRERKNSLTSSLRKKYSEFSKDLSISRSLGGNVNSISSINSISNSIDKQVDETNSIVEINQIWALDVDEFLQKFDEHHLIIFGTIVGKPKINRIIVHSESSVKYEKFFDLFCKFFSTKYACNLKRIGCFEYLCNEITTVFPIRLYDDFDAGKQLRLEIVDMLDERLLNEINDYLKRYYLERNDILKSIKHLFFSIMRQHHHHHHPGLLSLLAADFLAFNRRNYIISLKRYMLFYCLCVDNGKYKFYDLDNCRTANVDTIIKPIDANYSIYDDTLNFDEDLRVLAESYRLYECYYRNIFEIIVDILNLTLFHYKLSACDDRTIFECDSRLLIDKSCLRNITKYLDDKFERYRQATDERKRFVIHPVSKVENFLLDDSTIDNCYLTADAHLLVNDTLIDLIYSNVSKNKIGDFYKLIFSAIMIGDCNKLVIYNARLGEETSIDMIRNVDDVKQFVRTYRDRNVLLKYFTNKHR